MYGEHGRNKDTKFADEIKYKTTSYRKTFSGLLVLALPIAPPLVFVKTRVLVRFKGRCGYTKAAAPAATAPTATHAAVTRSRLVRFTDALFPSCFS